MKNALIARSRPRVDDEFAFAGKHVSSVVVDIDHAVVGFESAMTSFIQKSLHTRCDAPNPYGSVVSAVIPSLWSISLAAYTRPELSRSE